MQTELITWNSSSGWNKLTSFLKQADLVLCFFDPKLAQNSSLFLEIKKFFPNSIVLGCSTAGEIFQEEVQEDSLVLVALKLEKSWFEYRTAKVSNKLEFKQVGLELSKSLPKEDLQLGFLLSVGHNINGSELLEGILQNFPKQIPLSGGLAGDGIKFTKTYVLVNSSLMDDSIILIGFYGKDFIAKTGSFGGWSNFGPVRKITKSEGNVLYELDHKPALDLYKEYLGDEANFLPASALRFPINIFPSEKSSDSVVRTILSINEEEKSMTFAGNIPTSYFCRLMTASFESLIEGASQASKMINFFNKENSLAILISCIGRKLVLGQRTVEEIEAVRANVGKLTQLIGFYSYGEIAPSGKLLDCELHNQTMTITFLSEK